MQMSPTLETVTVEGEYVGKAFFTALRPDDPDAPAALQNGQTTSIAPWRCWQHSIAWIRHKLELCGHVEGRTCSKKPLWSHA